jgi:hypothetical protein
LSKIFVKKNRKKLFVKKIVKISLEILKQYNLKPSFSIIRDDKAKDRAGVGNKPPCLSIKIVKKFIKS